MCGHEAEADHLLAAAAPAPGVGVGAGRKQAGWLSILTPIFLLLAWHTKGGSTNQPARPRRPAGDPLPSAQLRSEVYGSHCFSYGDTHVPGAVKRGGKARPQAGLPRFNRDRLCSPQPGDGQVLEFVSDGCTLDPFEARQFLSTFAGRTLWIVGDSVMMQFHRVLTGYLLPPAEREENLTSQTPITERGYATTHQSIPSIRQKAKHEAVPGEASCHTYAVGSSRICFVTANPKLVAPINLRMWGLMHPDDVLFLNIGLHLQTSTQVHSEMQDFAQFVQASRTQGAMPRAIWRQTTAQHFPGHPGGLFGPWTAWHEDYRGNGRFNCENFPMHELRGMDFRNSAQDLVMRKLGIPIMEVFEMSAQASDLHTGSEYVHRTSGGKQRWRVDCTHWCEYPGSMLEVWAMMLQNMLSHLDGILDRVEHGVRHP